MALIPHYCWPFYIYFGEKLIHILCLAFVRVFYHNNRNEIRTKRLVFCSVLVLLAYHPTVLWPAVSAKDFSSLIEGRWSLVVSFLDASTILFDSLSLNSLVVRCLSQDHLISLGFFVMIWGFT